MIIGEKFLGSELYSRASLQSLAEKDTEFEALKDKLLHVASLDEAGHIPNYSGLLEQLRDPYIEKPIKFKRGQLRWKNTTYNILTGNKFPKATANTKAFYRSIRKIVYWRKPIGDDWKYKDQIDEKEKSGILNLAVDIMNIIIARGKPYGLSNLEETISRYREISDSLLMLVQQIFEKDPEAKIEQNEALEYVIEEGEARELVMETLTKNRLTALLKEKFGVIIERTTENKQVKNNDGSETKTKIHRDFYKGIRKKDPKSIITDPEDSTQKQLLDTLEEALLDYVSDIPKSENIQISKIVLPILHIYNVKQDIQDLDIWISGFKTCLENPNNSISDCVSKSLETIKKMTSLDNQNPPENKAPEDNKPVSNLNKDNEAPHFKTTYQRYHDWDYFRVMDTFDSYLFGKKKRHPKGNVIKFPIVEAPKYIEKGFLAPACPLGYAWDESEKTCVEIQEGDKNGNDK